MRKISLIALLFLFFWNQVGYQLSYWVEQLWIEEQQREYLISLLPDHAFEKIADNPQIQWEEEGREFRYQHRLYDVARIEWVNGVKVYLVVSDEKENELAHEFLRTVVQHRNTQSEKSSTAAAVKFFQNLYVDFPEELMLPRCTPHSPRFHYTVTIHSNYLHEILIPPPLYS
ncbi:MAG: hypothetical protein ACKO6K_05515 [Chitinophagaceae bacterium]